MGRSASWLVVGLLTVVLGGLWFVLRDDALPVSGAAAAGTPSPRAREMELPARDRDVPVADDEAASPEPLSIPEPNHVAKPWDPDDPVGLLLYGSVTDPDGQLVEAAQHWVNWTDAKGARRSALVSAGTYSFAGLRPGSGDLAFGLQGSLPFEQPLELTSAEPVRRVDIQLERSVMLCVKLIDPSGQPLWENLPGDAWSRPKFGVVASPEPPGPRLRPTGNRMIDWNAHGTWISILELWGERKVDAGCHGMLDLRSPLPLWVSLAHRHVVLASQLVEPGATEIVFVLTQEEVLATFGSVRVQVIDAGTGEPITTARVDVSTFQSSGSGAPVDEQGVYEQDDLPPGLLDLGVRAEGYETVRDTILLESGEELDLGQRALGPATTIRGRVVDGQGAPRAVRLSYAPADWHHDSMGRIPRVSLKSTADGEFTISALGRRRYVIWSRDTEGVGSPLQVVDATSGDVDGVSIVVQELTEVGFHRSWPQDVFHEVTLLDARGLALWRSVLTGPGVWRRSYPRGEYVLVVAGAAREVRFTVGASSTEVTLPTP